MKTFRVTRTFDLDKLHNELVAQGMPVVTVRGSGDLPGPLFYGVIVLEDAADLGVVAQTVAAHVEGRVPSRTPTAAQRDAALAKMEKL